MHDIEAAERERLAERGRAEWRAGDDFVRKIEELEIGEEQRHAREKARASQPAPCSCSQNSRAVALEMADEINEHRHDDGEDIRGGEGGDEERERGEQTCL